jgi:hypothetical protein
MFGAWNQLVAWLSISTHGSSWFIFCGIVARSVYCQRLTEGTNRTMSGPGNSSQVSFTTWSWRSWLCLLFMRVKKVANRLRQWYSVCYMGNIGCAKWMICTNDSESSMNWSVMICWLFWIILPKLMTQFDRLGRAKQSWLQRSAFIKREYWWSWGHKLNQIH